VSLLGKTRRLTSGRCPFCAHELDAVTPGPGEDADAAPSPGDFSVCIQCSAVLVFDGDPLALRAPTDAELQEVGGYCSMQVLQQALGQLHGRDRRQ
jgi:hypothetical protein